MKTVVGVVQGEVGGREIHPESDRRDWAGERKLKSPVSLGLVRRLRTNVRDVR